MDSKIEIFIANVPGASVSVLYRKEEYMALLMKRITDALDEVCGRTDLGQLYINGIRLQDSQKSIEEYHFLEDLVPYNPKKNIDWGDIRRPLDICSYRYTAIADISDIKGACIVGLYEFPTGRVVSVGTNVECICDCTTGYRVVCRRGYGILELSQEKFRCPHCNQSNEIVPIMFGFKNCKYRFRGTMLSGEQYTSNWKDVRGKDGYQLVSRSEAIAWSCLIVESATRRSGGV